MIEGRVLVGDTGHSNQKGDEDSGGSMREREERVGGEEKRKARHVITKEPGGYPKKPEPSKCG